MPGRVLVTGASGFVGSAIIEELLKRGYPVCGLVHTKPLDDADGRVRSVQGDLFDDTALDKGMKDCIAVIHLVGIIRERPIQGITFERIHDQGTRAVVDAAKRNRIKRYIHMSALGSRPDAVSRYHRTKYAAEEYVRHSGLDWTIFRPSLIHGPQGEFMRQEAQWARRKAPPFLFMPYFGAGLFGTQGAGKLQPVYVNDIARAFVDALEKPRTVGEVYLLGGRKEVTWPQLHHICSQAIVGKPRRVLAIPAWKARLLTRIVPRALLPFNRDQVIMSQEDNTCDLTKFKEDFGWEPQDFEPTLKTYAGEL